MVTKLVKSAFLSMKATSPLHTVPGWSSSRCFTSSHNCDAHILVLLPLISCISHLLLTHSEMKLHTRASVASTSAAGYGRVGFFFSFSSSHLKSAACKATFKIYWEGNRGCRGMGTYCFDAETVQCFILRDVAIRVCYWLRRSQKVKVNKVKSRAVGDQWVECLRSG